MYGKSIVWIMVYQVSTQLLNRMIRQVKPKRLVALCVPIGADADGNEVIGDLYTVFYDKEKRYYY